MNRIKIGVLASGGGSNLQSILDRSLDGSLSADVVLVISNNSGAKALERARMHGIDNFHISALTEGSFEAADKRITSEMESRGVDLVTLAGYMKKVGPVLLKTYEGRIINIHPALLPKFGGEGMYGMRVHEAVIAAREKESGATVHLVDNDYDHGTVLSQVKVPVLPCDTPETLQKRVLEKEHEILPRTIQEIAEKWGKKVMEKKCSRITDELIERAISEDLGSGDITTDSIVPADLVSTAFLFSKEKGVLSGIDVAMNVFHKIDPSLKTKALYKDGQIINKGHKIADITGSVASILKAERTSLNFLGRMTGIASKTAQYVEIIKGCNAKILDTRKTAPTMRHLDKYSVKVGGGSNHRFGLYDMVLIKDNHIAVSGGIRIAVDLVIEHLNKNLSNYKIEVECKSFDEVLEAAYTPIDIIMLDNMEISEIRKSVSRIRKISSELGKPLRIEVSGNISTKNVREIAETGVDYISIGELTHSVTNHDFSLLFVEL
jgi:nicotinate-nucleotide pyrophosphorylase (carboxylating)